MKYVTHNRTKFRSTSKQQAVQANLTHSFALGASITTKFPEPLKLEWHAADTTLRCNKTTDLVLAGLTSHKDDERAIDAIENDGENNGDRRDTDGISQNATSILSDNASFDFNHNVRGDANEQVSVTEESLQEDADSLASSQHMRYQWVETDGESEDSISVRRSGRKVNHDMGLSHPEKADDSFVSGYKANLRGLECKDHLIRARSSSLESFSEKVPNRREPPNEEATIPFLIYTDSAPIERS